jgi:hypothetical protein
VQFGQEGVVLSMLIGGLIGSLVTAILFLFPLWRSLSRAGFSPAWSLLILIPYLWPVTIFTLVGVLAFGHWPMVVGPAERTSWRAISATSWVQVSPEEAVRSRHFGLDGWLLVLYGMVVAGAPISVFNAFSPMHRKSYQELTGMAPEGVIILSGIAVVWTIVLLIFIPMKRPLVPRLLVAGSWLHMFLFSVIMLVFGTLTPMSLVWLGAGMIYVLLFSWYWLKSKRVNVTYLNRIPAG